MKTKACYLLLYVAWAAGFICLMCHTFTTPDLDVIPTLGVYALFLISAAIGSACCNSSCCKKGD